MKPVVLLFFTFMYVQAYSSLHGRFRGAMSNVERGFGKLLNDVVFDFKDTVHCTISALGQVLVMNGILDETSDYNNRCRYAKQKNKPKTRDYRHKSFFEKRFENTRPNTHSSEARLEHISQELENSILNVNKSINHILRRHELNSNFKVISEILKVETDRLNAVSDLLERELENISINIRNEILRLRMGNKKPPHETIWEDLKVLHDLKGKSSNKTEINQISNLIDRVVNELQVPPSDKLLSEHEKLEEIRKQLSKYASRKNEQTDVLNTKEMLQTQIGTEKEIKSFKDLAQNIMDKDKREIAGTDVAQVFKLEATSQGSNSEKSLFDVDLASIDNSNPFYNPNLSTDTKKIVEDAKSIMDESKKSEELINNFFKEQQHSNTDVFSNSDVFNFG